MLRYAMLCGIFLLFGMTRLWRLPSLPYGLHIDEAGMAYDAWCLSKYGVDRYLKSWPVYLTNLGGGQSSLYAFLCAFLFKIFGYSVWLIRLPAVIFSFLNLVFGMKLAREIYPERPYAPVAAGALLTVCPYFIMAARFGLDCNLMLGMSTVFLYLFVTAVKGGRVGRYMAAGVAGGVLLYTYALTYMILPLFLILALVYLFRVKRFSWKGWVAMAIPMGLLAIPLILVQIVNFFDLEEFRLACFTITKLRRYRASEVGFFGIRKFCVALFCIFFGDFLEEPLQYNSAPGFANLYLATLLLCMVGALAALRRLWVSVRRRDPDFLALVLLWAIGIVFFESHIPVNVNRINGVFTAVALLAVEGMEALLCMVGRLRPIRKSGSRGYRTGIAAGLILLYTICFARFSIYYYGGRYTAENTMLPYFDITVPEAVSFIEQSDVLRQKQTQMPQVEIYYALSALESPYVLRIGDGDGMAFGNYHFNGLGEIRDDYNYIVWEGFEKYGGNLREAGFSEERFEGYSLFYRE